MSQPLKVLPILDLDIYRDGRGSSGKRTVLRVFESNDGGKITRYFDFAQADESGDLKRSLIPLLDIDVVKLDSAIMLAQETFVDMLSAKPQEDPVKLPKLIRVR